MAKSILYSDKARRALEKGINTLSEAVAVTLGPLGRNVVLGTDFGVPEIINDGVTIAKAIELENHIENTGVSLIRQAAAKTNDAAGDGTTTAIVLASAIVKAGLRNVAAGANAIAIRDGIEKATRFVVEQVAVHARPVEGTKAIAQVGTISAGNDATVGEMIATAMSKVGREGVITLEEGKSMVTELEVTDGMRFEQGYISPYFMTNTERMEALLEDAYVLLVNGKVNAIQDLVPLLEAVSKAGKPLLIIAEEVGKDVLATLVLNQLRGTLRVAAVKAPGFGGGRTAILQDIAALTEGQVMSEETGLTLAAATLEMLGQARRITLTQASTTLVAEGNEQSVKSRCEQLRRELDNADSDYEKESLQNRLAKLSGGVAVIKVGAATETEMKDRKYKLEDAINATKAAVEEGIVPGGGATLAHLAPQLETWAKAQLNEEGLTGALIVARALSAPLERIVDNAGQNGAIIVEKIKTHEFDVGYDALANKFVNMFDAGIVDPAKVTRSALQNAASIAAITLTTECIVAETSYPKKDISAGAIATQFDY